MSATVTVACKLPAGIILRVFEHKEFQEPGPGGSRTVMRAFEVGGGEMRQVIAGNAAPHGMSPKAQVIGGYALTHNVPADFWEAWYDQNRDSEIVKNNIIFAYEKPAMTSGAAKEHRDARSGMERITPDTDPRVPKRKLKTFDPKDNE